MTIPSNVAAALTRLSAGSPTGYNNGDYNASTNPYGFAQGGHRTNLYLLTADMKLVATWFDTATQPVVDISTQITTLAAISANIVTLAGISTSVTTLAGLASAITTLSGIASAISTAAANAASISSVAGNATNINTLAGLSAALTALGAITSNISAVAAISGNVTTVAGISASITALAAVAAAISTVATNIGNVNTVAGIATQVAAVGAIASAVSTVASNLTAINVVSTNAVDISTVAAGIANINTAAANMAAILAAPAQATAAAASAVSAQTYAAAAARVALFMTFSTATDDTDPGNGKFKFNNATISSATIGYFDLQDVSGGDLTDWLASWDDSTNLTRRGVITLVNAANTAIWAKFNVSGGNVDGTGYRKIALTPIRVNGTFSNNAVFSVDFTPAGDKGADGAGSGDVLGPAGGVVDGEIVVYNSTTGKAVKGSGGKLVSDFATAAQGALAATALQPAAVGATVQAYDPDLASIASLTGAANKMLYGTGANTWALADLTAAGRALLDDADAAAQRGTLGLVIGTNVQAYDADLTAIAALVSAADKLPYSTGAGTWSLADFTSYGRSVVASVNAAAALTTLGVSSFVQTLLDDTTASAFRTTLGVAIGTDVQAYDADLAAIAGLTSAANKGIMFSGSGTAATFDLSAAGRALVDDADAAAQRDTLSAFGVVRTQVFTSSGTYTPHAKMLYCIVEVVGGGSGGGGVAGNASYCSGAGGGGGGGYSRKLCSASDIGASKAVTVGAGGNGGASGSNNGSAGSASSLGSLCTANGGTVAETGGAAAGIAGNGGAAGTGDIAYAGAPGGNGMLVAQATSHAMGGTGGNGPWGGGAAGVRASGGTTATAGNAGRNYGGGGGGAASNGAANAAGGNGSAGIVIITEFCSA